MLADIRALFTKGLCKVFAVRKKRASRADPGSSTAEGSTENQRKYGSDRWIEGATRVAEAAHAVGEAVPLVGGPLKAASEGLLIILRRANVSFIYLSSVDLYNQLLRKSSRTETTSKN
jgi:hypothetical protein